MEFSFDDFVLDDIDFDGVLKKPKQKTSDVLAENARQFINYARIRTENIKPKTFQIINNAIADLRLPMPGEQIRIRTQQQFNMIALVMAIAECHQKIDELTIATYTLNKEAWNIIIDMLQSGIIKKLNLMLASSYGFRDAAQYTEMKKMAVLLSDDYDISLIFAWCHFKITLARCGDNFYQIEGSMNYSTNNMAEQLSFSNDDDLYHFDYDFINDLMVNRDLKSLEIVC